ncbi:MAG TPA: hypothetical protein VGL99_31790 [Chloroflexota bacterium]|jgi:hypothetical protein
MTTTFEQSTIEVHVASSEPSIVAPPKPNGPAAAAILAAGIGCFALGLLVILSEAIPAFKTSLNLYGPVGPLSGKTLAQVAIYLAAWGGLSYAWRGRNIPFSAVYVATLILIALGLVGTFPLIYEAFTRN